MFKVAHSGESPNTYIAKHSHKALKMLMSGEYKYSKEYKAIQKGLEAARKALAESNKVYFGIK